MRRLAFALLILLTPLGCDDGAGGPGQLTGAVVTPGPVLGGAVVEVVGKGITGFSGLGATRALWAPTATVDTYRVVLLSSSAGALQFQVSVEDVKGKRPQGSLVSLTTVENLPVPATADYEVTFRK